MLPTRRLLWRVARRTPILNRRQFSADILPSLVSTASPEFAQKKEAMDALVGDFEAKVADARRGGGAKAAERMRSKGKMLPRERYVDSQDFRRLFCIAYEPIVS